MTVPTLSITAAAIVAAALLVIVAEPFGSGRRPAVATPNAPSARRLASHSSTVGGVTFVNYNLNRVVAQSPSMHAHSSTLKYPVLGANDDAIAFGSGSAWVLETAEASGGPAKPIGTPDRSDCGALVRLDSAAMTATGTRSLKGCPLALTFGDGSVWVLGMQIGTAGYQLTRVDPANMTVQASAIIDGGPGGVTPEGDTGSKYLFVATGGASVTVAVQTRSGASQVVTLDAKTLATVASVTIPQARGEATALAANSSAAWLGTTGGWVYRIDSRTGQIGGERQLGARVLSLSASGQAIWMTIALPSSKPARAYPGFDTLELDPVTGAVKHDTGLPLLLAATDGSDVWGIFSAPQHGNYIARIDPTTRTVAGITSSPFKAPAFTPDSIRVSDGAAWIINTNLQTLTKIVQVP
ncbi:MAG: hypothetical protein ACRDL5_09030 [Solirubrobacteraceae bacterium]